MIKPLSDRIINGIPTVIRAVLTLFLILIGTGFLILVVLIAPVVIQNKLADLQVGSQLSSVDQQFNMPSSLLPADASDTTIFPQQAGNFQRGTIDIQKNTDYCGAQLEIVSRCIQTSYYVPGEDPTHLWVWAYKYAGIFEELEGVIRFESKFAFKYELRENGNNPYLYLVTTYMFGPPHLTDVVWQNGGWLIGIRGDYEEIAAFLPDFAYKQGVEE